MQVVTGNVYLRAAMHGMFVFVSALCAIARAHSADDKEKGAEPASAAKDRGGKRRIVGKAHSGGGLRPRDSRRKRCAGLDPHCADAYARRAQANFLKGLPDASLPDLNEAIRLSPRCARAFRPASRRLL